MWVVSVLPCLLSTPSSPPNDCREALPPWNLLFLSLPLLPPSLLTLKHPLPSLPDLPRSPGLPPGPGQVVTSLLAHQTLRAPQAEHQLDGQGLALPGPVALCTALGPDDVEENLSPPFTFSIITR